MASKHHIKEYNQHHFIFTANNARQNGITWFRELEVAKAIIPLSIHKDLHREFAPVELPSFREVREFQGFDSTAKVFAWELCDSKYERVRQVGSYFIWQNEFIDLEFEKRRIERRVA